MYILSSENQVEAILDIIESVPTDQLRKKLTEFFDKLDNQVVYQIEEARAAGAEPGWW